jgi:hypothetical protein
MSHVFRTRGRARATCPPVEFIRRFLDHVLPRRFVKIRHFGLFAAVHVRTRLAHARHLLDGTTATATPRAATAPASAPAPPAAPPFAALLLQLTGIDLARCPLCHQRTMVRHPLRRECRGPPHPRSRR